MFTHMWQHNCLKIKHSGFVKKEVHNALASIAVCKENIMCPHALLSPPKHQEINFKHFTIIFNVVKTHLYIYIKPYMPVCK